MKYRSKPVTIEAIQFTGPESVGRMIDAWGAKFKPALADIQRPGGLFIDTLFNGLMYANLTDWVIKGTVGEFYPCRDDVFKHKYEEE
jgi:hypothetical protein